MPYRTGLIPNRLFPTLGLKCKPPFVRRKEIVSPEFQFLAASVRAVVKSGTAFLHLNMLQALQRRDQKRFKVFAMEQELETLTDNNAKDIKRMRAAWAMESRIQNDADRRLLVQRLNSSIWDRNTRIDTVRKLMEAGRGHQSRYIEPTILASMQQRGLNEVGERNG